jgi:TBC1 domain family member 5
VIPSDYSAQLTSLLRYPSPHDSPIGRHHTIILLNQALKLQLSPTSNTGQSVILENQSLLDIPADPPELPPPPPIRQVHKPRQSSPPLTRHTQDQQSISHSRQSNSSFPENLTRTILERGESFGINKTVMNAVSELRVGQSCLSHGSLPC